MSSNSSRYTDLNASDQTRYSALNDSVSRIESGPSNQVVALEPDRIPIQQFRTVVPSFSTPGCPPLAITPSGDKVLGSAVKYGQTQYPMLIMINNLITIYSKEELERESVVSVKSPSYDPNVADSVNSSLMGTTDKNVTCTTCYQDHARCIGHMGHIDLNVMVYHPSYLDTIRRILTSVCNSCGGLLLNDQEMINKGILSKISERLVFTKSDNELITLGVLRVENGQREYTLSEDQMRAEGYLRVESSRSYRVSTHQRLTRVAEASRGLPCRRHYEGDNLKSCELNPVFIPEGSKKNYKIMYKTASGEHELDIERVNKILKEITLEDAAILGFDTEWSHPSRMILRAFPVMPPCSRPPDISDGVQKPDHLTMAYVDIVTSNNKLGGPLTKTEQADEILKLNNYIKHFIDNSDGWYTKGGVELKTIKQRTNGKEGLMRGLMQGKRGNFFGRSVLSPDPSLRFGQVGIPEVMASNLTLPVRIFGANLASMTQNVREGKVSFITQANGSFAGVRRPIKTSEMGTLELAIGDMLEVHAKNGNKIIFNRQPTIHKQSMMAGDIVIAKSLTFRLHLSATTPYNADFDGDEGNAYAVQTLDGLAEVDEIMHIRECIMTAQTNRPIVGLVQDSLISYYLMTAPGRMIEPWLYFDCLTALTNVDGLPSLNERLAAVGVPMYSGQALFSALLPEDFYYTYTSDEKDNDVVIINGVLISGRISKVHVGPAANSIIQVLWKDYGVDRTVDFLTDGPWVSNVFITAIGFSTGLADCQPADQSYLKELKDEYTRVKMLVENQGGRLQDPIEEQQREKRIVEHLNASKSIGSKIVLDRIPADNSMKVMVFSGAKGSKANITQITGNSGQQFMDNKRMPLAVSEGQRALQYFQKGDLDAAGQGYVSNSLLKGLSPAEQFYTQVGGREGLSNSANKTSETGTIQRRIIKALEDVKVMNDGTVRSPPGQVLQFAYGGDGFDGSYLTRISSRAGIATSFIDLNHSINRINAIHGYVDFTKSTEVKRVSGELIDEERDELPQPEDD